MALTDFHHGFTGLCNRLSKAALNHSVMRGGGQKKGEGGSRN